MEFDRTLVFLVFLYAILPGLAAFGIGTALNRPSWPAPIRSIAVLLQVIGALPVIISVIGLVVGAVGVRS